MRLNIYPEDLTGETEIVEKEGHRGIRFYLDSRPNDVKSAITFWAPEDKEELWNTLFFAAAKVDEEL